MVSVGCPHPGLGKALLILFLLSLSLFAHLQVPGQPEGPRHQGHVGHREDDAQAKRREEGGNGKRVREKNVLMKIRSICRPHQKRELPAKRLILQIGSHQERKNEIGSISPRASENPPSRAVMKSPPLLPHIPFQILIDYGQKHCSFGVKPHMLDLMGDSFIIAIQPELEGRYDLYILRSMMSPQPHFWQRCLPSSPPQVDP